MANKHAPIIERFTTIYTDRSQGGDWRSWPKSSTGPKLDDAHLDKVEVQLGHPLPEDYREFMRDYAGIWFENGPTFVYRDNYGENEGGIFGFDDSREGASIADGYYGALKNCLVMSGLEGEDVYPGIHLLRDVPGPVEELGWPEELLPIASTGGSSAICLALFGLRPGAIFLFWSDIYLIAESFDEFMHLLKK